MKKLLLLALVVLLVGAVSVSTSQVKFCVGPKVGLVMSNASFDPDLGAGVTKSSRTGIVGGAAFEVMFSGVPVGIEADLLYAQGGTILEQNVTVLGTTYNVKITEKLSFIQIPILLKGKFATKSIVSPYVYAGPALGIVASAKELDEVSGQGSQETDIKDQTSSTDFQLLFGGGAEFNVAPKVGLTFDIRYGLGLTNLIKDPGTSNASVKSRGLYFMAGAMFYL
jgi:opacity protein-like surface antigen